MNKKLVAMLTFSSLTFTIGLSPCAGKDLSGIKALQKSLKSSASAVAGKLTGKVCVVDFSEAGDSKYTSEFGQMLAEILSNHLVNQKIRKYEVLERRELVKIMRDSILFGSDTQTIDRLQKEAGMDVLVSGSYNGTGTEISVSVKAVSAKTGTVLASVNCRVDKATGYEKMMVHRFTQMGVADEKAEGSGAGEVLELEVGVFYEGGDGKLYPVREGIVLSTKDNYCVYVRPVQDCYLYLYQVDSSQNAFKLFPNTDYNSNNNPLKAGIEYWVPQGKEFLYLDKNIGREEIYILATKAPALGLDMIKEATQSQILDTIKTMGVGGKRGSEIVKKVKGTRGNAMELISRKLTARGDFFYALSFIHQ